MSVLRVIDTETCGLNGGVVEVASVDIDYSLAIINPMSDFVKPDRPIEFSAMAIHHITEDIVADKPLIDDVVGRYQGADFYIATTQTLIKVYFQKWAENGYAQES
ncbi:Exodeoxyribonuclease 10 [Hafnia alvei]|nr:Exodeoxyribonuclease 10 [Hafnia alvei]